MTYKTLSLFTKATLVGALGLLGANVYSQVTDNSCERLLASAHQGTEFPVTDHWRRSNRGLFSAFRANAPFYWSYAAKGKNLPPFLLEAAAIEGLGFGDIHILNFGLVEYPGGIRKYQPLDFDDGGRVSLLLDVARGMAGIQVSPYRTSMRSLWDAYISGLRGVKVEPPAFVQTLKEKSEKEFLELQKQHLASLTHHDRFTAKARLTPIAEADPKTAAIYFSSREKIYASLGEAKVLDVGYYIKPDGGSQDIPRFWFLIEDQGAQQIVEFKTMGDPATQLYEKQAPSAMRFNTLVKTFRTANPVGYYQVVDAGQYQFIARTHLKSFPLVDPKKDKAEKDIKEGVELSLYMLNRVGRWESTQESGPRLLQLLTANEDRMFTNFENVVNKYIEVMQQEADKLAQSSQ